MNQPSSNRVGVHAIENSHISFPSKPRGPMDDPLFKRGHCDSSNRAICNSGSEDALLPCASGGSSIETVIVEG